MVPTFTCGLFRSNFAFAIFASCWLKNGERVFGTRGSERRSPIPDSRTPTTRELRLHLRYDFFRLALRYFVVMRELHGVHRASLRHRAQLRGVSEHLAERHRRDDYLRL